MTISRSARALGFVLAIASGVLVFLCYPNWDLHGLAWFAFVPLLLAARRATPGRGFRLGLLAGLVTNVGGFHWITQMLQDFGHLPAVLTWVIVLGGGALQGLSMAVGLGLWRWLVRRGAPVALAAMLCLWLGEAVTPMVFPWFIANAIARETPMVQIAELGGVHLVSAQLYAVNAALFDLLDATLGRRPPALRMIGATAAAVLLSGLFGLWRIGDIEQRQERAPKLRIGLVEGNIGIWEKQAEHLRGADRVRTLRHNLLVHQRMSADLEKDGVDLIVWPESAYMPYGPAPVLYTKDRFVAVDGAGRIFAHDGTDLVRVAERRRGLPDQGEPLTGLSSPRGDVLRMIVAGKRVLTLAPWVTREVRAPRGETLVDTAASPIDMFGASSPGLVAARSGRVWALAFEDEPLPGDAPAAAAPELIELPAFGVGDVDINAVGMAGNGRAWLVGRGGAMLRLMGHSVQRFAGPSDQDLWDVAGDPLGSELVAVGSNGTILEIRGDRVSIATRGGKDLYAAFYGPDGTAWAAGAQGTLLRRPAGGRWGRVPLRTGGIDLHAGAADQDGAVLLLGKGAAWHAADGRHFARIAGVDGTLADVIGFEAKASYTIPRSAKRIPAARAPLPPASLQYPEDVVADRRLGEFDRNTPRRGFATPLLFGALTYGGVLPRRNSACRACFNSALLLDRRGDILDLTDKAFLLVFGEYMPLGERFPELYDLIPEGSRFQPGKRTRPLVLGKARIGVLICYEDLLPRQAARVAAHDPNVLINMTNDAWFGRTPEPYHHLQLAQMRTVEYRRWLVRSTNTGVSAFIDATGRRRQETALTGAETLVADVPLLEGRTVYASLGDWPLVVLAIAMLLLLARALRAKAASGPKRRRKPAKKRASKAGEASKAGTASKAGAGARAGSRGSVGSARGNKLKPKKLGS